MKIFSFGVSKRISEFLASYNWENEPSFIMNPHTEYLLLEGERKNQYIIIEPEYQAITNEKGELADCIIHLFGVDVITFPASYIPNYVIGMMHWRTYKELFADNLSKEIKVQIGDDLRLLSMFYNEFTYRGIQFITLDTYEVSDNYYDEENDII